MQCLKKREESEYSDSVTSVHTCAPRNHLARRVHAFRKRILNIQCNLRHFDFTFGKICKRGHSFLIPDESFLPRAGPARSFLSGRRKALHGALITASIRYPLSYTWQRYLLAIRLGALQCNTRTYVREVRAQLRIERRSAAPLSYVDKDMILSFITSFGYLADS